MVKIKRLEALKKSVKAAGFDMISTGNPPWTHIEDWNPPLKLKKRTIDFIKYGNRVYQVCGIHVLGYDHDKRKKK